MGQHQSDTVPLNISVSQGLVLGLLLFAVYCSLVSDVITQHGVKYHQYADDTQLHLSMHGCTLTTLPRVSLFCCLYR